tara:strand:+ start:190 stop:603 length:414 start_codon:yes stop_codon:yes gene_type:complete
MDTSKILQKLIIFSLIFLFFSILLVFFNPTSDLVTEFNDKNYLTWSNDESLWPFAIILILVLVLHLFSFYMLYKFKKNGKRVFVSTLIILVLTDLSGGSYAASSIEIFLSTVVWLIDGAILAILYITPVSKKFHKFP